jgi:hypothetical protein
MHRFERLKTDWVIAGTDHVGSRKVFFFNQAHHDGEIQIRIAVSNSFRDPEQQAWYLLDDTVK